MFGGTFKSKSQHGSRSLSWVGNTRMLSARSTSDFSDWRFFPTLSNFNIFWELVWKSRTLNGILTVRNTHRKPWPVLSYPRGKLSRRNFVFFRLLCELQIYYIWTSGSRRHLFPPLFSLWLSSLSSVLSFAVHRPGCTTSESAHFSHLSHVLFKLSGIFVGLNTGAQTVPDSYWQTSASSFLFRIWWRKLRISLRGMQTEKFWRSFDCGVENHNPVQ